MKQAKIQSMAILPCNRILLRVDLRQNLTKSKMLMNQEQFKEKTVTS